MLRSGSRLRATGSTAVSLSLVAAVQRDRLRHAQVKSGMHVSDFMRCQLLGGCVLALLQFVIYVSVVAICCLHRLRCKL